MAELPEFQLLYDLYGNVLPWGKGNVSGEFVFLAGAEGRDPATNAVLGKGEGGETAVVIGDVREQALLVWTKIKNNLEDFGTSLENIIWIKHYVPRRADWAAIRSVEMDFFRKNCPDLAQRPRPGTNFMNLSLDLYDMAIEIEVWAVRPGTDFKLYTVNDSHGECLPLAQGIVVKPFILLSGADGSDPETQLVIDRNKRIASALVVGNSKEQTTQSWNKIKNSLEEMGSSLENIVYIRHYVARRQDWASVREAEMEFFKDHCTDLAQRPRPGTTLKNIGLDLEEALVTIEAVAVPPGTDFKIYPHYDRYGELMPYAKGVVVGKKFAILSGVDGIDPETEVVIDKKRRIAAGMAIGDPREQGDLIWSKVKSWLEEMGTSPEYMVHESPVLAKAEDWPQVAAATHKDGRIARAATLLKNVGLDLEEMSSIQDVVIAALP